MLPWVCSEIDHRGRQNMVKTSVTYWPAARVPLFLFLSHFDVICYLWSITEQTHGDMECETRADKGYPHWWNCKRACDWSAWMSLRRVFTWPRGDFSAGASSLRFPLKALYLFTWYHHKTKCHAGASHPGVSSPRSGFFALMYKGVVYLQKKICGKGETWSLHYPC